MQIEQDDRFVHDRFGKVVVSSVVEIYRSYQTDDGCRDPHDAVVRFKECNDGWEPRAAPPWNKQIDQFLEKAERVES
jgi:hypothetical protein